MIRQALSMQMTDTAARENHTAGSSQGCTQRVQCPPDLVDTAAQMLAQQYPVMDLTPAAIARSALMHEADIRADYPDFRDFLALLLLNLLDTIRAEIVAATLDLRPGIDRMWRGIEANLDAHLRMPYVHGLSRTLHGHSGARELRRVRCQVTVLFFMLEFDAIGVANAAEHAREANAMILEIARTEYEAGQMLAGRRAALFAHIRNLAQPPAAA